MRKELTEACINPLLFSTSALARPKKKKNMVRPDVNYIKFSDVCGCVPECVCTRGLGGSGLGEGRAICFPDDIGTETH